MAGRESEPASRWTYKETAWLAEGHRQPIYCGAFNHFAQHMGNLLATVGGHRATIYSCQPGGTLEVLQVFCDSDPSEEYYACTWSLDVGAGGGPLLLLAGKNGQLLAVNPATGVLQACLEGHGSAINDIVVHPTRPHFVVTASRDHSLRLWNLRTRCCVLVFQGDGGHRNEVLTLSWQPGGEYLLLSAGMDNHIKIWSLAQHEHTLAASDEWEPGCPRPFPARHVTMPVFSTERVHWNYVDCLRWLGDFVLSKSVDNRVVLWRPDDTTRQHAKDGDVQLVQELQLEDCAGVWWLRFAMDYWCTTLAVGTSTGRVLLYDPHAQQPRPKARLRPRRSAASLVRQTAVSYDGSIVVSCHEDGSLTRYDRVDSSSSQPRPESVANVGSGATSPAGSHDSSSSSSEDESDGG